MVRREEPAQTMVGKMSRSTLFRSVSGLSPDRGTLRVRGASLILLLEETGLATPQFLQLSRVALLSSNSRLTKSSRMTLGVNMIKSTLMSNSATSYFKLWAS